MSARVALVTGAGAGIGRAIARRFASRGVSVAVLDMLSVPVQAVAQEIVAAGGLAIAIEANVTVSADVRRAVASVLDKWDKCDIVVNNAGVLRLGGLREVSEADFRLTLDVTLWGTYLVCREVVPSMVTSHFGRIVNVASNAYKGSPNAPHYAAAKASLLGFTRSLAMEFGPDGITANCVAPGFIDTPMTGELHEMRRQVISSAPVRRLGQPDDVAAAVDFLAGDDAGYITGEVLHVTGGR